MVLFVFFSLCHGVVCLFFFMSLCCLSFFLYVIVLFVFFSLCHCVVCLFFFMSLCCLSFFDQYARLYVIKDLVTWNKFPSKSVWYLSYKLYIHIFAYLVQDKKQKLLRVLCYKGISIVIRVIQKMLYIFEWIKYYSNMQENIPVEKDVHAYC
jgi:hypothetical protein